MIIPKYWAKGVAKVKDEGGEIELAFWRWSDTSQAEAAQAAEARAREIASRFTSFRQLDRYGYADRPLREEVVEAIGGSAGRESAIITRNAYGALILNTARAMFIDIDFDTQERSGPFLSLGKLTGKGAPSQLTKQLERIEAWARQHPQWSMRVYRTFGGLRGLITNELFEPADPSSIEVLKSLNSDPLYVRLCRAQECFRARLTPKPWRCGIAAPPSRYPWPTSSAEITQRQWERNYEYATNRYTTCQLVKEIGSQSMHPEVARIVAVHDQYACRGEGLNLA
jgi:hypothetical protein